jgi:hypothetical protein
MVQYSQNEIFIQLLGICFLAFCGRILKEPLGRIGGRGNGAAGKHHLIAAPLTAFSTSSRVSPVRFWMRPRTSSCLPSIYLEIVVHERGPLLLQLAFGDVPVAFDI